MKKTFRLIAALAAVSVAFAACNKENGSKNDEEGGEETEALIKIDADFADWAKADLLVDYKGGNNGWLMTDGQRLDLLKALKVAADGVYLYIYAEVDRNTNDGGGIRWDGVELDPAFAGPIDIYIDADANAETGGINWVWEPFGWEYLFESATVFSATPGDLSDGSLFGFTGEDGTDIWAVDPPAREDLTQAGFATGAGVVENGVVKYELSLVRALMPKIKGNQITLGVIVQSDNWRLIGAYPTLAQETTDFVKCPGFTITLPDAE